MVAVAAGVPRSWGASEAERRLRFPCDDVVPDPTDRWLRAVTVRADPSTVFRWLCQLKVAPYSYDLLDNRARRSPRTLTPGAEELAVGQPVMRIFELVGFEVDRHLTLTMRSPRARRLFGDFAITYAVRPAAPAGTRLIVKLLTVNSGSALAEIHRRAMAWGDLMMMRKQLLTLRRLAERTERASSR